MTTRRLLLSVLVLAACGTPVSRPDASVEPSMEPLPAFALLDVNPASATSGQSVGPTRYRGQVSGWYFTHTN
jgi:hypothetical protein